MIGVGNNQLMNSGAIMYEDGGFGVMADYNGNYVQKSTSYGSTWSSLTGSPNQQWLSVAISSTGQYITGVYSNIFSPDTGRICTSSDYGVTWTLRSFTDFWQVVDMSASGQYQLAGCFDGSGSSFAVLVKSSNYGVTWTILDYNDSIHSVAVSGTGQYMLYSPGTNYILLSTNYGLGWSTITGPGIRQWIGFAISHTGQYQTAISSVDNLAYVSSDYGVNWTQKTGFITPIDVRISGTGQYQYLAQNSNIRMSSDYGVTWATAGDSPSKDWRAIDCSYSGQYVVAASGTTFSRYIYRSNDYGATWTASAAQYNIQNKGLRLNKVS